jgi:hypothetical protein
MVRQLNQERRADDMNRMDGPATQKGQRQETKFNLYKDETE